MATTYTVCSAVDVTRTSKRGGSTGVRYPWYDRSIPVGGGFFIERSYEEYAADKGRPTVPTKDLAKMNMKYKTYKATKKGAFGYMCERVK